MTTNNGLILTNFGSYDQGDYLVPLKNGKIMMVGSTAGFNDDNLVLARYNANGSLDSTFDGDGKLTSTRLMDISAVQVQRDGKIVIAGTSTEGFTIARINIDGSLDKTFSSDGIASARFTNYDRVMSLFIQPDDKYVVGGIAWANGYWNLELARFNIDGSLDTSFNNDGLVSTGSGRDGGEAKSIASQPDGKTVVAGNIGGANGVWRFDRSGYPDSGFGSNGRFLTDLDGTGQPGTDNLYNIYPLENGKILAIGDSNNSQVALVRLTTNGSLDSSFGNDGILFLETGSTSRLMKVMMLPSGKILAAGWSDQDCMLMRFDSDYTVDTSFGILGKVVCKTSDWSAVNNIAVQSDGKVLVVGSKDTDVALLRINTNGKLDTSFNGTDINTINHEPTGYVTLSDNTPTVGDTLIASNDLVDLDGLGTIAYQWKAGTKLLGTGDSYTLTSNEIGKTITVIAKYTDLLGTAESVGSTATTAVSDVPVSANAGVSITGTDFVTSEQGDTALFSVSLNSAPARDVTIAFTSSDTTEGIITNPSLTFTSANWATPQSFTVTGQNDTLVDGDVAYTLSVKITTLDVNYKSVTINSITLTNQAPPVVKVENITGTDGNDILRGTDAPSYMLGKAGDDDLAGGGGNDTLWGSYGDDVMSGNDGNDILYGEQDNDYLEGGAGNDTLDGGLGVDTMIGGAGNDTYYLGYDAVDVIDDQGLPTDVDTVIMPYQLTRYTLPSGIEQGTIAAGTAASSLTGNDSDNSLTGNDGNNVLDGAVGRDSLFGGAGNDELIGGDGNDTVNGGIGNDLIVGGNGAGDDDYVGGAGIDTVKYKSAVTGIDVNLGLGTAGGNDIGHDRLSSLENVSGGQAGDTLTGDKGKNALDGFTGNDTISGGAGADRLTGGLGADHFKFNAGADTGLTAKTRDVIVDFSHNQGDKIDLSAIDANSVLANDNAFSTLKVGGVFPGAFSSQGALYFDKTTHILYGNNDADSSADFSIQLLGVSGLAATDFIL